MPVELDSFRFLTKSYAGDFFDIKECDTYSGEMCFRLNVQPSAFLNTPEKVAELYQNIRKVSSMVPVSVVTTAIPFNIPGSAPNTNEVPAILPTEALVINGMFIAPTINGVFMSKTFFGDTCTINVDLSGMITVINNFLGQKNTFALNNLVSSTC